MTDESVLKFVGLRTLTEDERATVTELSLKGVDRIDRVVHNLKEVVVHVKGTHRSEQDKTHHRFSVHVHGNSDDGPFDSKKADEYELPKALHMVFEDLETHLKSKLRK